VVSLIRSTSAVLMPLCLANASTLQPGACAGVSQEEKAGRAQALANIAHEQVLIYCFLGTFAAPVVITCQSDLDN
jgi:hypothetical protein